ncbi:hypothetical protein [Bifidobacterium sp. SO1]|uniref:hypothetical protein n=1 Tax=Bifidobacterium sp. SO1 TaxID=2809029 RepID=UPI001BDC4628|nr:hypothetical protein [Bifidobacterium sp. SO1]MBT1162148.1 hypothetical protein [Bifidobacterium sp. SO1]
MTIINPDDQSLWMMGSDVEWVRGDYVQAFQHPGLLAKDNPWLVPNRLFAETMIRSNKEAVTAILGSLISWRVCTVDQLQAGLAVAPVPEFDRYEPNLYGALCRVGAINIGFNPRERFEHITIPHVWLSVGYKKKLVSDALKLFNGDRWLKDMLANGKLTSVHIHARHNTYAAHVGLAFTANPHTRITGGDGWGALTSIDAQSVSESGIDKLCATDLVTLLDNNVLAGIEVQSSTTNVEKKMKNWSRMLAYSPMRRRGLVCVWLFIRNQKDGKYPSVTPILERASQFDEMMVGTPSVAQRSGFAYWEEWFNPDGSPTERFGEYTDLTKNRRSLFDPNWKQYAPTVRPLSVLDEWGWQVMRDSIRREWGWDVSMWTMPNAYRGGFYGFTGLREGASK